MTLFNAFSKTLRLAFFGQLLFVSLCSGILLRLQVSFSHAFYDGLGIELLTIGLILSASFVLTYKLLPSLKTQIPWINIGFSMVLGMIITTGQTLLLWSISHTGYGGLLAYAYIIVTGGALASSLYLFVTYKINIANRFLFIGLTIVLGLVLGIIPIISDGLVYAFVLVQFLLTMVIQIRERADRRAMVIIAIAGLAILTLSVALFRSEINIYHNQKKYFDRVVYAAQTRLHNIEVTAWKGAYWFYQNRINQFSTIDKWMYFEPMVHPAAHLAKHRQRVLLFGGDNGCTLSELLKYKDLQKVEVIPFDCGLADIAGNHPIFTRENRDAFNNPKVNINCTDPFLFMSENTVTFDMIIVDLPDPTDLEVNQYYTQEFYTYCNRLLKLGGVIVTQAGSPYYATKAYYAIGHTMKQSGIEAVAYHNQVPTLGEWGWLIGVKGKTGEDIRSTLMSIDFSQSQTTWLNNEAMKMMLSFGKPYVSIDTLEVNKLANPVIHEYYTQGNWKF